MTIDREQWKDNFRPAPEEPDAAFITDTDMFLFADQIADAIEDVADGTTLGEDSVGETQLQPDSVGRPQLQTAAVGSDEIDDAVVEAKHLAPGSVGSAAVADGSLLGADLHPDAKIQPAQVEGTAVITTDSRLSNARTPTAHKSTHATGGSDPLTPSDIGAATAAQGALADTAVQPAALGSAAAANVADFATAAQGDLADGAIPKGTGTTKGDLVAWTGAGVPVRLPAPADGQVIVSDSSTAAGWRGTAVADASIIGNRMTTEQARGETTDGFLARTTSALTVVPDAGPFGLDSAVEVRATASIAGLRVIYGATSRTASTPDNGILPVLPGQVMTFAGFARATVPVSGLGWRGVIYWWTAAGNVAASEPFIVGSEYVASEDYRMVMVSGKPPADARFASVSLATVGSAANTPEVVLFTALSWHRGAGGQWDLPGRPTVAAGAVPSSTVTAKGQILAGSSAGTVVAAPAGANGQVVVYDSSTASGLAAASAPSAAVLGNLLTDGQSRSASLTNFLARSISTLTLETVNWPDGGGTSVIKATNDRDPGGTPLGAVGIYFGGPRSGFSFTGGDIGVTPGQTYTWMCLVRGQGAGTPNAVTAEIFWWQSDGTTAASTASNSGSSVAMSTTDFRLVMVSAKAPPNATRASMRTTGTLQEGNFWEFAAISWHRGAGGLWVPGQSGIPVPHTGVRANPSNTAQVQNWNPETLAWVTV